MKSIATSPPTSQLRRWSLLFVATFASGLQLANHMSHAAGLNAHIAENVKQPDLSQNQYSEPELSGNDNLMNYDGDILLSQEFYFYQPSKDQLFESSSASSKEATSAAANVRGPPPSSATHQDGAHIRPDETVCQPEAGSINNLGGGNSTLDCNNNATDPSGGSNISTAAAKTFTASINTTANVFDKPTGSVSSAKQNTGNSNVGPNNASSASGSGSFSAKKKNPYCIGSRDSESSFNWLCQGITLVKVPIELVPKPMSLRLQNTGIETLTRSSFPTYQDTLRDFSMENAPKLLAIEEGTFADLIKLRVVRAHWTTSGFDDNTRLRKWPNLSRFEQRRILNSLDLDNNRIETLSKEPMNIRTEILNLEFNLISSIDEFTFNGSEIGTLSLSGNSQLSFIHPNAFANLKNLIKLDLSSTSIAQLPTVGLQQLRTLIIRETYALKRIPSIYVFPVLEEAHLTYAYHCCSFQYPQTHDPSAYEEHLRLQDELNKICGNRQAGRPPASAPEADQQNTSNDQQTSTPTSDFEGYFETEQKVGVGAADFIADTQQRPPPTSAQAPAGMRAQPKLQALDNNDTAAAGSSANQPSAAPAAAAIDLPGLWPQYIECGELAMKSTSFPNISCTPEPDAFNPCEDIMGYSVLRVAVWFVVGASVFGNMSVIVVLMGVFKRLSVPKFLQLNLAIGDLFMGIYLAMLAMADLTTVGSYFNYAIDWQHGYGCKVAGAASLFASQLSIFTLCVITFERYYTITYSIDLNMRLQLGWATRIMIVGWLFAFASAMLPIFADISSYTKTSICLPMRTYTLLDRAFLALLLLVDSSAFVIILACYLRMYLLIIRQKTEATVKERTIAMRMALLVFTDFACWAPIIFFGATALFGTPLISVTNSKILIVFFYPLNSMANPFLYVISTRQYRRDLNYLAARWHVWRKNLFRRDSDFYSNNNAVYGAAQYTGSALNAHLGVVAAVTAVAPTNKHLRNKAAALANMNGLTEEGRVVCTKSSKGRYIIRHQILTECQGALPALRGTRGAYPLRTLAGGPGRGVAAKPTGKRISAGARDIPGSGDCRDELELLSESASKVVNVSTGLEGAQMAMELRNPKNGGCQVGGSNDGITRLPGSSGYLVVRDTYTRKLEARGGASGQKEKQAARSRSQRANRYNICGERFVERCNCCCKCYPCWSGGDGTSSRATPVDKQREEELNDKATPVIELTPTSGVRDFRSITLVTPLPADTSPNPTNSTVASVQQQTDDNNTKHDAKISETNDNKDGRIMLRKCSCLAVDDIFREAVRSANQLTRPKCVTHDNDNDYSDQQDLQPSKQVSCTSDIDILGNISYNDPTASSHSGLSTPQSSHQTAANNIHRQQAVATTTCCKSARAECCHCSRGECQDGARSSAGPTSGLESGVITQQISTPICSRRCDHYHRHHHHHHHRHRNHPHHHHQHNHSRHHHHHNHRRHNSHHHWRCHHVGRQAADGDTDGHHQLLASGRQKSAIEQRCSLQITQCNEVVLGDMVNGAGELHLIDDNPIDESIIIQNEPSSNEGCSTSVGEPHRLESILKTSKEGVSATNNELMSRASNGGRWSPMISLLRGGSFQSNATRRKDKKRVSIVDHHSG